jgi:D-alanyl-D-alanine carboxypeptidase
MAESAPHGDGRPEALARRFAELNGARLLACTCSPGASAVEVRVAIADAAAEARAVLDVDLLAPAQSDDGFTGLHPLVAAAVRRLTAAARGAVWVVSGYRSSAEQLRLWEEAVERYGSPEAADDWVAPPGRSLHERGLAVDLGGDVELAARLAARLELPLHRPLANEPWHFELLGSRGG